MGSKPLIYAYIALGSNMGDREHYLTEAIRQLDAYDNIEVSGRSGIYETEPVGVTDQAPFLNMVLELKISLTAEELFTIMLLIEQNLGRTRELRWGPRTIDLDMLLFDEVRQDDPQLILPHPRMMERAFVLVPLVEVMQMRSPQQAARLTTHLEGLEGKEGVTLWKKI
ncbi:2-amino-4-hydroxy-6-hydroxymethyldihydropteridine diphosphokinase [Paenibacillus radicis (ex Xue et al. 2023)]|uniref:2-amino-4-hydroxy-6-hydroxymethyldihydropteridine diphosphokinase n=1 Tax=Paenibacillus radicis (ex Xue et al. 2023) TaxID=2972489 RepID=A0ABT1YSH3_9BACL|nr:2-amino-4-hydroxy-6-hydroxymethyldihydropteridine diphosphokinase [Paenibacillus radicis (ex Xue et al. 2023)]MCR8636137.1 2-amino-4-hydroxy-6-hydroxymethyldihydropteridine diphosphokinase [Paenibacillus radicis (ex Xue et al. 2023)]